MPNLINSNDFDFEGFGISFLEVLANNGLPIVIKKNAGYKHFITEWNNQRYN